MRTLELSTLLILLGALPAIRAEAAPAEPKLSDEAASAQSATSAEKAEKALNAGDRKLAISLLSPPPVQGPGTCVLAKAFLEQDQPERAMLYAERCQSAGTDFRSHISALKQLLRQKKRAPVSLVFSPAEARGKVSASKVSAGKVSSVFDASDVLLHDEEIWLPVGSYRIDLRAPGFESAAFALEVDSPDRMLLPLTLEKSKEVVATDIDYGKEPGSDLGSVSTAADPRPKKFKPIMPKRYQIAPDPTAVPLDDSGEGRGPWPWIAAGGGAAGVGAGIAMHLGDNTTGALVGYGLGGGLLAWAAYLFLRSDAPETQPPDRISLLISPASTLASGTSELSLGIQGLWY